MRLSDILSPLYLSKRGALQRLPQKYRALRLNQAIKIFQPILVFILAAQICNSTFAGDTETTLLDLSFEGPGQIVKSTGKGSFHGPLPENVKVNFPIWNSSTVTSIPVSEDGVNFTRFNVYKVDYAAMLELEPKDIDVPGYYEVAVRFRSSDEPLMIVFRQLKSPYKEFYRSSLDYTHEWKTQLIYVKLADTFKGSVTPPVKLNTNNVGMLIYLSDGVTDIAYIELTKIDRDTYMAGVEASIRRPQKQNNYIGNGRFPLGLPPSWSINRESTQEVITSDSNKLSPAGWPSLKIHSPEQLRVYSSSFQVPNPKETVKATFLYTSSGSWSVRYGNTVLELPETETWDEATFQFHPDPSADGHQLIFSGTGTLNLDSVVVNDPTDNTSINNNDCEIALSSSDSEIKDTRIQFSDKSAQVSYWATGELDGVTLQGNVTNIYGETVAIPEVDLSEKPRGKIGYDLFPEKTLGAFRIDVWAEKNGARISPDSEIVMNRVRRPVYWDQDAPNSPFGSHFVPNQRVIQTMKAAGMNWVRANESYAIDMTAWGFLEPKPGEWTFQDEKVKAYRDAHIKILGFLGTAPEWASYFVEGNESYHYFDKMYQPKNIEAFRNYVRTIVNHYKGVIDEYHFQNEPWGAHFWHKEFDAQKKKFSQGETPAQDYVKFSKIAYEEMKSVSSETVMYGFNTSGGKKGVEWTKETFDAGAYEYCDMIDYHYYNVNGQLNCYPGDPVSTAYNMAVGYIQENVGKPMKPVVMSEGCPVKSSSTQLFPDGKRMGKPFTGLRKNSIPWATDTASIDMSDLLCRFVIAHLKEGVKRIFLYSDHTYHNVLRAPSFPVLLGADGYPYPTLSAFSNMAWLLEDRHIVSHTEVGKDVWAYFFEGRGKTVAVVSGLKLGSYTAPEDARLQYIDLFGNPLDRTPRYNGQIFYVLTDIKPEELSTLLISDSVPSPEPPQTQPTKTKSTSGEDDAPIEHTEF